MCQHCKGLMAELPHKNSHSQIGSASYGNVTSSSLVARFNLPQRSVKLGEANTWVPGGTALAAGATLADLACDMRKTRLGYFISPRA
jgi:hypothetical protein